MSAPITGTTRGGGVWTPQFLTGIDQQRCIGCGRCYKVCPRQVLALIERENVDDEEDDVVMVMSVADAMDCIGCGSCARVCPKQCHAHAAAAF